MDVMERIPPQQLSRRQKALLPIQYGAVHVPICQFRREPTHLEELDWENYPQVFIWRENQTVVCLSDNMLPNYPQKNVFFLMCHDGRHMRKGAIYGITDAAIAETAAFFWSLKYSGERHAYLDFQHGGLFSFNYAALQPEQLKRIFNAQPKRLVEIQTGIWTAEQSVALASCSSPLQLRLSTTSMRIGGFSFQDKGTAFVDALEQRQTSFGSLYVDFEPNDVPFSTENLERLVKLEDTFEKIGFFIMKQETVLLPLTAKANALEYQWRATYIPPNDFNALVIPAKDLVINIFLDGSDDWYHRVVSFWNRVAELGHFEKLDLNLDYEDERHVEYLKLDDGGNSIAEALIRVLNGNPNLKHLDVSGMHVNWSIHFRNIFKALEVHPGFRSLVVKSLPRNDPNYVWIKELITANQNITVTDLEGNTYAAVSRIRF